jgi:hypothetical protein
VRHSYCSRWYGRVAPDLRQLILQQNGIWGLAVLETGQGKLQALKILRELLGWSIPEVAQVKQWLPGVVRTHKELSSSWAKSF